LNSAQNRPKTGLNRVVEAAASKMRRHER